MSGLSLIYNLKMILHVWCSSASFSSLTLVAAMKLYIREGFVLWTLPSSRRSHDGTLEISNEKQTNSHQTKLPSHRKQQSKQSSSIEHQLISHQSIHVHLRTINLLEKVLNNLYCYRSLLYYNAVIQKRSITLCSLLNCLESSIVSQEIRLIIARSAFLWITQHLLARLRLWSCHQLQRVHIWK